MQTTQTFSDFVRADQDVTGSTTLVNVTSLTAPVSANRNYGFEAMIQFNLAGIVSGFKFGVNTPSSPTNLIYTIQAVSSGLAIAGIGLGATLAAALATTGLHHAQINGVIENGANAGTLALQFAQNVSDGSAITIKRGSWLKVWFL